MIDSVQRIKQMLSVRVWLPTVLISSSLMTGIVAGNPAQAAQNARQSLPAVSQLERWYNPSNGDHGDTNFPVQPPCCGYHHEEYLGLIIEQAGVSGTTPLNGCLVASWDEMDSTSPNCEGQQFLGRIGWIFTSANAVINSGWGGTPTAVYRCIVNGSGDHMDSLDPGCEGQHTEGILGYTSN